MKKSKWTASILSVTVLTVIGSLVTVECQNLGTEQRGNSLLDSENLKRGIQSRHPRQAEPVYEDGGEYEEYEEEVEEDTPTPVPPPERKPEVDEAVPKIPKEANEEREVEGGDAEYEEYDESENEETNAAQEYEEEETRKDEERREEERKEEERRREAERKEEDRHRQERREDERKAQEEEDRLEEEARHAEENRLVEEQRMLEERRKQEQRRQEYEEREDEEDEDYDSRTPPAVPTVPSSTPLPEDPPTAETTPAIIAEIAPQFERNEEIEPPRRDENAEEDREEEDQDGKRAEVPSEESEEGEGPVPTRTPVSIQESGRQDLERYTGETKGEESAASSSSESSESEGSVEANEVTHPPASTTTTTTTFTTPEPIPEEGVKEEEYETSEEEESATTPDPPREIETVTPVPSLAPRPFIPFEPSAGSENVEENRDPNEYEVEPPASVENEVEESESPTPAKPFAPSTQSPAPPSAQPEIVDARVLGERERYHHPDLEIDEDENEEAELYEGRRFSGERRTNDENRINTDRTHLPTNPIGNEVDENSVTDLSRREPVHEEEKVMTTSQPPPSSPSPRYEEDEDEDESGDDDESDDIIPTKKVELGPSLPGENVDVGRKTTESPPVHIDFITRRPGSIGQEYQKANIECFPGYQLSPDGAECLDIDECGEEVCGQTQICSNLPGSYRCSCNPGFIKDFRNEKVCRDLNECEIGNGGCDGDCVNTQGSFYCSCSDAYELAANRRTCIPRPPTTTTTTSTTTTPPPSTTTMTPPPFQHSSPKPVFTGAILIGNEESPVKNCPTPPVPRGAGIAYLYCSRSPVGIHHRHSQMERRLIEDWTSRKSKGTGQQNNIHEPPPRSNLRPRQLRNRRNLRRRQRQTTYSPGSMCELRCRSGFELRGAYTLHCNASTGAWQGTTNGFCQALPKPDNHNLPTHADTTPSNEIPRFGQYQPTDFHPTAPSYLPEITSFRPIFHQPREPPREPMTPPPPATRLSDYLNEVEKYWGKPSRTSTPFGISTTTTRRPYHYNFPPVTYRSVVTPPTTPMTTTSRNSFIQLTYRFKTPWIKCPDDIRIDLQPNQNLAYVIIPQPQTNVDWWRQVSAEPSWAKGLETEVGPGKQRITFRARTSAPVNNTAECAFTLEIRDMDPPRVRECPEPFTLRLNHGQSARAVTWLEPHFSDNVRITSMKQSHHPGAIMTVGEHLINYEAKDPSDNVARCSFTVTVLPPHSPYNGNGYQSTHYRKPLNEGVTSPTTTTTTTSGRPEVHSTMRNVVCYVGKKGRRIVFLSRVVPRGCSEMSLDMVGAAVPGTFNALNTISQNSAENMATSQISSVSYAAHDTPSGSAFGQALSNGRNSNRMVHSTSSVTNGAHGTNSKSSSYAIAASSSSRNFEIPFLVDRQVYEEDDMDIPTAPPTTKTRSGGWVGGSQPDTFDHQAVQPPSNNGRRQRRPGNNGGRQQKPGTTDLRDGGQRNTQDATGRVL